jgi:CAAD domains of cyanobacterial aminoacyl-tRNA synthetase
MSIDLTTEITRIDEHDETLAEHPQKVAEHNSSEAETEEAEYDNAYVENATVENMEPIETIVADEAEVAAPSNDETMGDDARNMDKSPGEAAASLHSGGDAAQLVTDAPPLLDGEDDAMGYDERSIAKAPSEAAASLHSDEAVAALTPDSDPNLAIDEKSLLDSAQDTLKSIQSIDSAEYLDRAKAYAVDFFNTYRQLFVALGVVFLGIISLKLLVSALGAIDDIPLISPLLKIIGLGYVVWFVWRYLVREQDRQELLEAIDRTKAEIFGS